MITLHNLDHYCSSFSLWHSGLDRTCNYDYFSARRPIQSDYKDPVSVI